MGENQDQGSLEEEQKMSGDLRRQLEKIVDYASKVNENIISVNEHGGGVVHQGISAGTMRDDIGRLLQDSSTWEGDFPQKDDITGWLNQLKSQDIRTGYDPDLVNDLISKTRASL